MNKLRSEDEPLPRKLGESAMDRLRRRTWPAPKFAEASDDDKLKHLKRQRDDFVKPVKEEQRGFYKDDTSDLMFTGRWLASRDFEIYSRDGNHSWVIPVATCGFDADLLISTLNAPRLEVRAVVEEWPNVPQSVTFDIDEYKSDGTYSDTVSSLPSIDMARDIARVINERRRLRIEKGEI